MEIVIVALVAVGFWLVWKANKANDTINTPVVEEVKAPAIREKENIPPQSSKEADQIPKKPGEFSKKNPVRGCTLNVSYKQIDSDDD